MSGTHRVAFVVGLYPCWLGMMAVHELGHMVHAWASGGTVAAVRVPLVGFSITELKTNPHPQFVAWGGAVWGSLLPVAAWFLFRTLRWRGRDWAQFFAGFCLVTNGAYLGVGWMVRAGDAADLVRHGTPVGVVGAGGLVLLGAGLYLWHGMGRREMTNDETRMTNQ